MRERKKEREEEREKGREEERKKERERERKVKDIYGRRNDRRCRSNK